ncbi:MAG TPA: sigma 54-interacting transcriptional regulator [Acidobacteriota bacterium]|nr:sigma 54-interacting transcriptional regulator [Acidobacteriota bacterium]
MEKRLLSEYFQPDNVGIFRVSSKPQHQKLVDLASEKQVFAEVDYNLLVSDLLTRLVHSKPNELDAPIEEVLQLLVASLHINRAALFLEEEIDCKKFLLTYTKTGQSCHPQGKFYPSLTKILLNQGTNDLWFKAFLNNDKKYQELCPEYSSISVPLFYGDRIFGILALGIDQEVIWPEELKSRLHILAQVLSTSLMLRNTEQELQKSLTALEQAKAWIHQGKVCGSNEKATSSSPHADFQSNAMHGVLAKAEQVAATNATVLLSGETGTGKEMIASAIHEMSSRSDRPMVRVNCGAIPSALVESEMFGREKGAYTGALSRQIGRFELADQSTIFLDEITELPLEVQVKLLRVLQEKQIERLGNPKPIHVDVRIIAATNQNIEKAVQDGKFRQDLYYRLNVFPIEIPPLHERLEDIPMLVWAFVDELSQELGRKVESIASKSMEALTQYSWPGNVRELRNVVERAMIVSHSPELQIEIPKTNCASTFTAALTLKEMEMQHIRRVLENTGWKIRGKQGAAEMLGMKPTTLETRMAKLGIIRPESKNRL